MVVQLEFNFDDGMKRCNFDYVAFCDGLCSYYDCELYGFLRGV